MAAQSITLSREVLKWVQSLDLSFSVKNAKRDFANGFLVAEILSRYYPADLSMHSFDNGTSLASKRSNWELLLRFFNKKGILPGGTAVTKETVEEIIHAHPAAVETFINRIYEFLTGKKLAPAVLAPARDDAPSFAKPTAARVALELLRKPTMEMIQDTRTLRTHVSTALEQHDRSQQADRADNPGRYAVNRLSTAQYTASTRTGGRPLAASMAPGSAAGTVTVKSVAVAALSDESLAARFRARAPPEGAEIDAFRSATASRGGARAEEDAGGGGVDAGGSLASSNPPSPRGGGSPTAASAQPIPGGGAWTMTPAEMAVQLGPGRVLDMLNAAVLAALNGDPALARLDAARPPAFQVVELLLAAGESAGVSDAAGAAALRGIESIAAALAVACLASPRGFFHLVNTLFPVLKHLPEYTESFIAAADALSAVGAAMASGAATSPSISPRAASPTSAAITASSAAGTDSIASGLFQDFVLPLAVTVLKHAPGKRRPIIRIAQAFVSDVASSDRTPSSSARMLLIRSLRDAISDHATFAHCVAIAASMETHFDDQFADLYSYYSAIGLCSTSPPLRAASIAILNALLPQHTTLVLSQLPRLAEMRDDTWWDVRVQCVQLACGVLRLASTRGVEPSASDSKDGGEEPPSLGGITSSDVDMCVELLHAMVSPEVCAEIVSAFVSAAAPLLVTYPILVPLFVSSVVSLPPHTRLSLLGFTPAGGIAPPVQETCTHPNAVGLPPVFEPLTSPLPGLDIVRAIGDMAKRHSLQQLEVGHFQLLLLACRDATGVRAPGSKGEPYMMPADFTDALHVLLDHVYVGLCDPETSSIAVQVLRSGVLYAPGGVAFLTAPTMTGSLYLLHEPPSGVPDAATQEAVRDLFNDLISLGTPYAPAAQSAIRNFSQTYPVQFHVSPLRGLLPPPSAKETGGRSGRK